MELFHIFAVVQVRSPVASNEATFISAPAFMIYPSGKLNLWLPVTEIKYQPVKSMSLSETLLTETHSDPLSSPEITTGIFIVFSAGAVVGVAVGSGDGVAIGTGVAVGSGVGEGKEVGVGKEVVVGTDVAVDETVIGISVGVTDGTSLTTGTDVGGRMVVVSLCCVLLPHPVNISKTNDINSITCLI